VLFQWEISSLTSHSEARGVFQNLQLGLSVCNRSSARWPQVFDWLFESKKIMGMGWSDLDLWIFKTPPGFYPKCSKKGDWGYLLAISFFIWRPQNFLKIVLTGPWNSRSSQGHALLGVILEKFDQHQPPYKRYCLKAKALLFQMSYSPGLRGGVVFVYLFFENLLCKWFVFAIILR